MPLERCQLENKPGWRWGPTGKCYTYDPTNAISESAARSAARQQGKAIEAKKERRGDREQK